METRWTRCRCGEMVLTERLPLHQLSSDCNAKAALKKEGLR